jgi:hypothetical protein
VNFNNIRQRLEYICYNGIVMNVDRDKTALKRLSDEDSGYMDASPAERVGFMWELTAEIWSLRDADCVERRLQRGVANLVRQ